MSSWKNYVSDIHRQLTDMAVTDISGKVLSPDDAFTEWARLTLELKKKRCVIYLAGNGASASMASHMAADLAKNGRLHTQVLTDPSLMTAISNDISYDEVYAFPLSVRANPGDMLVCISSSGGSPNILRAAETAKQAGMTIVTLSSLKEDNPLRKMGALNFFVPAGTYGYAESTHAAVLHHWMDAVEEKDET